MAHALGFCASLVPRSFGVPRPRLCRLAVLHASTPYGCFLHIKTPFTLKHHSFYLNLQRLVVAYLEFFTENNRAYNIYMPWIEYHGCVLCLCAFPELCGIPHAKH